MSLKGWEDIPDRRYFSKENDPHGDRSYHSDILKKRKASALGTFGSGPMDVEQSEELERLREEYLKNASETVCGMINDFFEPIITESVQNDSVMA